MRKTLAEMNVNPFQTERHGLPAIETYAVGRVGRKQTGAKVHLLRVVTLDTGERYSASAPCNGNGQHIGHPFKGLDTDRITCERCLALMGWSR